MHLILTVTAVIAALLALPQLAAAQSGTWAVDADGNWSDTGNWSGGTVADGSGNTADFSTVDITADRTVHLDSARTIGSLVFGDAGTGTAAGWILDNGGSAANILTLDGTSPAITVSALGAGMSATISAQVAGTAGLTKSGDGNLAVASPMRYSGRTTINQGTLALSGGNNTLVVNQPLQVNNGGALDLGSNNQYVGNLSGAGGSITGSGTLTVNEQTDSVFAGSIGGSVNLVKAGGQYMTLTLTGAGSTTGTVAVISGNSTPRERGLARDLGGGLSLRDSGTLLSTTGIAIRNSTFMIDNTGATNLFNRLNDTAPITLDNGTIRYMGQVGSNSTETLGAVTVSGFSTINVISGNNGYQQDGASTWLTLAKLTRNFGSAIQLDRSDHLGQTNNDPRIFLADTNGLTFVNGTIPGMVTYNDNDKYYPVSYIDGLGFGKMGQDNFPDHYYVAGGGFAGENTLTNAAATNDFLTNAKQQVRPGGQTVNSLGIQGSGYGPSDVPLTFQNTNDTLTIASGWLCMWFQQTQIGERAMRGAITSGRSELFMLGGGTLHWGDDANVNTIHSVIKDNGTDAVTFSINLGRRTYLTANNTYTGGTMVNGMVARDAGRSFYNKLYLQGDPGSVVIPNATNSADGLVITSADVEMLANAGQIGSKNIVTLNGGSTLTLLGDNTLAGIVFNSNGGTATPTVTPGGVLTIKGDIVVTGSNPTVVPTISGGTLDLKAAKVRIASGAKLALNFNDIVVVKALYLGGQQQLGGDYGRDAAGSEYFDGPGLLRMSPPGVRLIVR